MALSGRRAVDSFWTPFSLCHEARFCEYRRLRGGWSPYGYLVDRAANPPTPSFPADSPQLNTTFSIQQLVSNWITTIAAEDLSPLTLKWYRSDVEKYLAWLSAVASDLNPSKSDAARYRDHLLAKGRAAATVNRALCAILRYIQWGQGVGVASATGKANMIKEVRGPRRALTRIEATRLLRVMERYGTYRDTAIVMLGMGAGLRVGEIEALEVRDVSFTAQRAEIEVRSGKGRVSRRVRAGENTRKALLERIHEIEQAGREPGVKLRSSRDGPRDRVLTEMGRRLASEPGISDDALEKLVEGQKLIGVLASQIQELVERDGYLAGISGLQPHMLRRTHGQARRAAGSSLEVVSRDLGHRKIDTTIYTAPMGDEWDVIEIKYL